MEPKTLDHVAFWLADREPIAEFLTTKLGLHVIDPEECIDCGACEPECPVEAIFPEDALPDKWQPFVEINYAYGKGLDVVNQLTDAYATEHNVQNPPLE